jgi:hypothetical protein
VPPLDITPVVTALDGIRDAIPKSTADPDVKRIADVANGFPVDEPSQAGKFATLVKAAVDNYGFPADLAQILLS